MQGRVAASVSAATHNSTIHNYDPTQIGKDQPRLQLSSHPYSLVCIIMRSSFANKLGTNTLRIILDAGQLNWKRT